MTSRLTLFPDTNVFLQCKALKQIPWRDISAADEIDLWVGVPVQEEIDRLKGDGSLRRARRARETNSFFRAALLSSDESLILRESAPKVTLRFAPTLPPNRETAPALDLTRADDHLLDEVMHFRRTDPAAQILSGDTGMILRARRLEVPLIPVPNGWLLEPEKDERDRKIAALEAQVAALQSTEATLSVSLTKEDSASLESIGGSFPQYPDLTEADMARLMDTLKLRHPEVKTFGAGSTSQGTLGQVDGLNSLIERMSRWTAPTADQISAYQRKYAEWIDKARKRFEQLGSLLNMQHRPRQFRIALANEGSRPADEVLLEIEVHGGVALLASTRDEVPDLIEKTRKLPLGTALPPPPAPPKGENIYESLARSTLFGRDHIDIATQLRQYAMPDLSGVRARFEPRDRHRFYRREEDDKPVAAVSFTCEEFRHQRAPEIFNLWIMVPMQSERGTAKLHIRVSARNMTTPVDLYVPIELKAESRSTYEIATKWRIEE
jgi:hypothetical protein